MEEVMIRELTDMELDTVSGGWYRRSSTEISAIFQAVKIEQENNALALVAVQENEANVTLVAVNA